MKGYLIDTNVISELRKGTRCNTKVSTWFASVEANQIYLSVMTLAEIRQGVVRIAKRDPGQSVHLESWRVRLENDFQELERLLAIDAEVAKAWGDLQGIRPISSVDGLLAATAAVHSLTIATRNVSDFNNLSVSVINPFD